MWASAKGRKDVVRYLIEKYITKPPREKEELRLEGAESDEEEGEVVRRSDVLLENVTLFLSQYLSDARKLKLQAAMDAQLSQEESLNSSQESAEPPPKKGLFGNALAYLRGGPKKDQPPVEDPLLRESLTTLERARSVAQLNEVLFDIGAQLVADKKKLGGWLRGL